MARCILTLFTLKYHEKHTKEQKAQNVTFSHLRYMLISVATCSTELEHNLLE